MMTEMNQETLDNMSQHDRKELLRALLESAEKLSYKIFQETEVGPERIRNGEIYENIRTATRVPLGGS